MADDLYCNLPPPIFRPLSNTPSSPSSTTARGASVTTTNIMSVYNDRHAGCIHGDCVVAMADGTHKKVKHIKKGDLVFTSLSHTQSQSQHSSLTRQINSNKDMSNTIDTSCIGEIECVVAYEINSEFKCTNPTNTTGTATFSAKTNETTTITLAYFHTGLIITPWHPVRYSSSSSSSTHSKWMFPQDVAHTVKSTSCEKVYNFVVKKYCQPPPHQQPSYNINTNTLASSIVVNGIECITLGHGIVNDVVAAHRFFGTELVIQALRRCNGWKEGYITLKSGAFVRKQHSYNDDIYDKKLWNDCSNTRAIKIKTNSDENICDDNTVVGINSNFS